MNRIQLSGAPYAGGTATGVIVKSTDVKLKAPVDPKLSFMTAFNYSDHKKETFGITKDTTKQPGLFTVPVSSIIGPEDNMVRPAGATNFHYEAEMVVVIGKKAENVSLEEAFPCTCTFLACIFLLCFCTICFLDWVPCRAGGRGGKTEEEPAGSAVSLACTIMHSLS